MAERLGQPPPSLLISRAWLAPALGLLVLALADSRLRPYSNLADHFLRDQDLVGLLAATSVLVLVLRWPAPGLRRLGWLKAGWRSRPWAWVLLACMISVLIGAGGWRLVMHAYPLSMDEWAARFDATIFGTGRLAANVPRAWQPYVRSLSTSFIAYAPARGTWASSYLPVNAALIAVGQSLRSGWLVPPALGALAILATWGCARRLWPERRELGVVAVLLLSSGAQFLLTAMTPYAMTALLALNMLWLWLLLDQRFLSQAAAVLVAFFACGLHQVLFHPLFAAPFVVCLWLQRRWSRAVLHTAAYLMIGFFWCAWPILTASSSGGGGSEGAAATAIMLIRGFDLRQAGVMAANLLRFIAWQNPLGVALGLVGGAAVLRGSGEPDPRRVGRAVLVGMVATVCVMLLLMPFQGHGWGYRYLHGFLGGGALLGAEGWRRLADRSGAAGGDAWPARVCLAAAASLTVLLPLRAYQASRFTEPYARAERQITRADADVVLVDADRLYYGLDLVRNTPNLERRPTAVDLGALTAAEIAQLCRQGRVALFDERAGAAAGVQRVQPFPALEHRPAHVAALAVAHRCATLLEPVRGMGR